MESVTRRLSETTLDCGEPDETMETDSKVLERQSIESDQAAVSRLRTRAVSGLGLKVRRWSQLGWSIQSSHPAPLTQSRQSTLLENSSQSSEPALPEPAENPLVQSPGLKRRIATGICYLSETLRSTVAVFHPHEAEESSSKQTDSETHKKHRRGRLTTSTFHSSPAERKYSERPEPETPKKHRRHPSVVSSVRSRICLSNPHAREIEKTSATSPSTPVPATNEQPPQIDVKIPSSFLGEERLSGVPKSALPIPKLLAKDRCGHSEHIKVVRKPATLTPTRRARTTDRVSPDTNSLRKAPGSSRSSSTARITCDLSTLCRQSQEPSNVRPFDDKQFFSLVGLGDSYSDCLSPVLGSPVPNSQGDNLISSPLLEEMGSKLHLTDAEELDLGHPGGKNNMTVLHCPVSDRCGVPDLSSGEEGPCLISSHNYKSGQRRVSFKSSRDDSMLSYAGNLESQTKSTETLLSPSEYGVAADCAMTNIERPSMGSRAAFTQRRADRDERYLATTFNEPDTEPDDNSQSELELDRAVTRHATHTTKSGRENFPNSQTDKIEGHDNVDVLLHTKNEARTFGRTNSMEVSLHTIDHQTSPADISHHTFEAIMKGPDESFWLKELPYAIEAVEKTPGHFLPSPDNRPNEVNNSPYHDINDSIPCAPKYTMISMCLTPNDAAAYNRISVDDERLSIFSSTKSSTNSSLDTAFSEYQSQDKFAANASATQAGGPTSVTDLKEGPRELYHGVPLFGDSPDQGNSPCNDTDEDCTVASRDSSCSVSPPLPKLLIQPRQAYPIPEIDGAELSPSDMDGSSEPSSPLTESEIRLCEQMVAETRAANRGPQLVPSICRDIGYWREVMVSQGMTAGHRPSDKEVERSLNAWWGPSSQTSSNTASTVDRPFLDSAIPMKSKTRFDTSNQNDGSAISRANSPKSSKLQFEMKRFAPPEVKPLAYTGHELDLELTSPGYQGSPPSTKSTTSDNTFRSYCQKKVCFAKDPEYIKSNNRSGISSRSPSPTRSAKWLSNTEKPDMVQKELKAGHEKGVEQLNLSLQDRQAQQEIEAHRMEKPRWRVPGAGLQPL